MMWDHEERKILVVHFRKEDMEEGAMVDSVWDEQNFKHGAAFSRSTARNRTGRNHVREVSQLKPGSGRVRCFGEWHADK